MCDIIDILLDEDNREPLIFTANDGRKIAFEQIAVIPYDKIYCILKPIDHIDNFADDEAVVFFVDETSEEPVLQVETNELTAIKVFEEYYDLLEENL